MKKIVIVVANGCVETVLTDCTESFGVEIVDFDSCFDSQDEKEALADYVDGLRATMQEL